MGCCSTRTCARSTSATSAPPRSYLNGSAGSLLTPSAPKSWPPGAGSVPLPLGAPCPTWFLHPIRGSTEEPDRAVARLDREHLQRAGPGGRFDGTGQRLECALGPRTISPATMS